MSKSTNTKSTTKPAANVKAEKKVHDIPAADMRRIVTEAAKEAGLPWEPVTGFTFPVRRLLWTNGGEYNKETKTWTVPAHVREEMQKAVDEVGGKVKAKIDASAAAKAAKEAAEAGTILPVA